jgi:hypothetical protein
MSPIQTHALKFSTVPGSYAVCQVPAAAPIPAWLPTAGLLSITRTADELSIVCPSHAVPAEVKAERAWLCLQLQGPFPFSTTGVLASFIQPLAENAIPIFALSTFNTDYVLVPEQHAGAAFEALRAAGHALIS